MKKSPYLLLALLVVLAGCYTQLLTGSNLSSGANARPAITADSNQTAGTYVQPAATSQGLIDCNCTPYEINSGLCWCQCDRCGSYHRLGYEYCPRGIYHSYWGWDYYSAYPWWYDDYYRGRGRYTRGGNHYDQDNHSTGYYPSSGTSSGGVPVNDSLPFIGDRSSHRGIIISTPVSLPLLEKPASPAPAAPAPIAIPASPGPSSPPTTPGDYRPSSNSVGPAVDSSKSSAGAVRERKRLR